MAANAATDLRFTTWAGKDLNLRRRTPADLQSAPFGHSGTDPCRRHDSARTWPIIDRSCRTNGQSTRWRAVAPANRRQRRRHRDCKNDQNGQRFDPCRYGVELVEDQAGAGDPEDHPEAVLEEPEAFDEARHQEIQRSQTEQGEPIGGQQGRGGPAGAWLHPHLRLPSLDHPLLQLERIRARLNRNGKVVLVVPSELWLKQRAYRSSDINQHLYTWTPQSLGNLFTRAGFVVERVEMLRHRLLPRTLTVYRMVPKRLFHYCCNAWGMLTRTRQIRIVATKGSEMDSGPSCGVVCR